MCKSWKQESSNHHFPELNLKHRAKFRLKACCSWKKTSLVMIALTIALGLSYLFQTNSNVAEGYKIKDLEQKIEVLKQENKKASLRYAELQSVDNLSVQVSELKLVATGKADIIAPVGSAVALK